MEIFYSYHQEFFPLANILLAFQRYNEALGALMQGIRSAAIQHDFRMCKYYCKLLTENGQFDDNTLKNFYQSLCETISISSLSEAQHYQYLQHMPEIRAMLVENPAGYPYATLMLKSNIADQSSRQVSILLAGIDTFLHLNGSTLMNPSISISHNSPLVFVINLCGTPVGILATTALILAAIGGVCKNFNEIAQAIISSQTIAANHRQRKTDQLEQEKLSAEIEHLKLENSSLQKQLNEHQTKITESGIIIYDAEFSTQDFDVSKLLPNR